MLKAVRLYLSHPQGRRLGCSEAETQRSRNSPGVTKATARRSKEIARHCWLNPESSSSFKFFAAVPSLSSLGVTVLGRTVFARLFVYDLFARFLQADGRTQFAPTGESRSFV
jgi:hypothetical protein